jgi:hypothetical protein
MPSPAIHYVKWLGKNFVNQLEVQFLKKSSCLSGNNLDKWPAFFCQIRQNSAPDLSEPTKFCSAPFVFGGQTFGPLPTQFIGQRSGKQCCQLLTCFLPDHPKNSASDEKIRLHTFSVLQKLIYKEKLGKNIVNQSIEHTAKKCGL